MYAKGHVCSCETHIKSADIWCVRGPAKPLSIQFVKLRAGSLITRTVKKDSIFFFILFPLTE